MQARAFTGPPFFVSGQIRRRRQVVRQRSAKPPPPVQIRAAPPISFNKSADSVNRRPHRGPSCHSLQSREVRGDAFGARLPFARLRLSVSSSSASSVCISASCRFPVRPPIGAQQPVEEFPHHRRRLRDQVGASRGQLQLKRARIVGVISAPQQAGALQSPNQLRDVHDLESCEVREFPLAGLAPLRENSASEPSTR